MSKNHTAEMFRILNKQDDKKYEFKRKFQTLRAGSEIVSPHKSRLTERVHVTNIAVFP
ncbi:hypothetical protein X975_22021, partial [Stegodyphus mimosarum]